jgi:hypothetical protein
MNFPDALTLVVLPMEKGPLLGSFHEVHPKVRGESVHMQVAGGAARVAARRHEQAGPAQAVERVGSRPFQIVVTEVPEEEREDNKIKSSFSPAGTASSLGSFLS